MNEELKSLMISHGIHKYIDSNCQARIELLFDLIVKECVACCGSQADKKNILKRFGFEVPSNVQYKAPDPHGSITSQYERKYNLP